MITTDIFSLRHMRQLSNKTLEVTMREVTRGQICNFMQKYSTLNYNQFYEIEETFTELRRLFPKETKDKYVFSEYIITTYPSRTLDAVEIFSRFDTIHDDFAKEINNIFLNEELPYELESGKISIVNNIVIPASMSKDMDLVKKDIQANLLKKEYRMLVDRLHSYAGYFLQEKLKTKAMNPPLDKFGNLDYNEAWKLLKGYLEKTQKANAFQVQSIHLAGGVLAEYGRIRNNKTPSHPNPIIDNESAEFAAKVLSAVLVLIEKIDK